MATATQKKNVAIFALFLLIVGTLINFTITKWLLDLQAEKISEHIVSINDQLKSTTKIKVIDFDLIVESLKDNATPQEMTKYMDILVQLAIKKGYMLVDVNNVLAVSPEQIITPIPKDKLFELARKEKITLTYMKDKPSDYMK